MLLLHDAFFYWLHRAMHTRLLFRATHLVHHRSVYPTAYAAYSFHPAEAFGEAFIVVVIIYLIPVHPLAFLVFQTISTAYNVYGHCGREFYPRRMATHWLGRWPTPPPRMWRTMRAGATTTGCIRCSGTGCWARSIPAYK